LCISGATLQRCYRLHSTACRGCSYCAWVAAARLNFPLLLLLLLLLLCCLAFVLGNLLDCYNHNYNHNYNPWTLPQCLDKITVLEQNAVSYYIEVVRLQLAKPSQGVSSQRASRRSHQQPHRGSGPPLLTNVLPTTPTLSRTKPGRSVAAN
jgi:hypothetical protein